MRTQVYYYNLKCKVCLSSKFGTLMGPLYRPTYIYHLVYDILSQENFNILSVWDLGAHVNLINCVCMWQTGIAQKLFNLVDLNITWFAISRYICPLDLFALHTKVHG